MTCSSGTGGFLKLSRLLVGIHRWVMVKMSLDCKLSGFNGRLPACSKLKKTKEQLHGPNSVRKWRRKLLFLWLIVVITLGSIWVFSSLNAGTLTGKDMTPDSCDGKAQILLQHFNVSKSQLHALASLFSESDQITSLQCTKNLGPKMLLSNSIACTLRLPCSELQEFHKQHRWIAENDEPRDQCPVRDEFIPRKFDLSMLDNTPMPFSSQSGTSSISANHQICEKNILLSSALADCAKEHCGSFYTFLKVSWLLLVVVIVSRKMSPLHLNFWRNQKKKLLHQPPVAQQQQQKQQLIERMNFYLKNNELRE